MVSLVLAKVYNIYLPALSSLNVCLVCLICTKPKVKTWHKLKYYFFSVAFGQSPANYFLLFF